MKRLLLFLVALGIFAWVKFTGTTPDYDDRWLGT